MTFYQGQVSLSHTSSLLPDLVEYPDPESSPTFPGRLSLTMKLLLFSLLAFAIILVIFSASVGAICRIQCRVVDTGDQVLELKNTARRTAKKI